MKIALDDRLSQIQPGGANWVEPALLAKDGDRAPILGGYWGCRLQSVVVTGHHYNDWFEARDGASHTFYLPHPQIGDMTTFTGYVDSVNARFDLRDNCLAVIGVDAVLSGIVLP